MNNSQPVNISSTRQKGADGEDAAAEYLLSKGYSIVSRNYQSRGGEIDCIAEAPDGTLVFAEVKSAKSGRFGHPAYWVTKAKQKTIAKMAQWYLAEHRITKKVCRFDVIAIVNGRVEHIRNAFFS